VLIKEIVQPKIEILNLLTLMSWEFLPSVGYKRRCLGECPSCSFHTMKVYVDHGQSYFKTDKKQCMTRAGECAQTNYKLMLILVEFEVFTKISSLSPHLAIPMLQIAIKHLKVSLFVCFLRGVP